MAAPRSTIDADCSSGRDIDIEYRSEDEVKFFEGPDIDGIFRKISIVNPDSDAVNPAFDITPAKYIDGFITEQGIFEPPFDFSSIVPGDAI